MRKISKKPPVAKSETGYVGRRAKPEESKRREQTGIFDIKDVRGRHESIIESVFSTEVDGGVIEKPKPLKKSKFKKYGIPGLVLVIILIGLGFYLTRDNSQNGDNVSTTSLASKYPDIKTPANASGTNVLVEANSIKVNSDDKTIVKELTSKTHIEPAKEVCALYNATDYCEVGTTQVALADGPYESKIYFARDIVHSKIFNKIENLREISPNVYVGTVNWLNNKKTFEIVVYPDGSGWFIGLPTPASNEVVNNVVVNYGIVGITK